jgi:hypothetical protein
MRERELPRQKQVPLINRPLIGQAVIKTFSVRNEQKDSKYFHSNYTLNKDLIPATRMKIKAA